MHETQRVYADKLADLKDVAAFKKLQKDLIGKVFEVINFFFVYFFFFTFLRGTLQSSNPGQGCLHLAIFSVRILHMATPKLAGGDVLVVDWLKRCTAES